MLITHFYSDPHYGHTNIIKHAQRPFSSTNAMNFALAENYRAKVPQDGVTIWTGDCFWSGYDGAALLRNLPGRKILVRGNHDGSVSKMLDFGFDLVVEALDILIAGFPVHVSHYPPKGATYVGQEHDTRYEELKNRQHRPKANMQSMATRMRKYKLTADVSTSVSMLGIMLRLVSNKLKT